MNISWHGKTCVRINTLSKKNGAVNILIDPLKKESGLNGPKESADIFLLTETGRKLKTSEGFVINNPGEYEIKEIYIRGMDTSPQNTIYIAEAEGINFCHLGLFNQEELSGPQVEKMGDLDILFIPVGDKDSIDAKKAAKIISQLEPRITIPINYNVPGLKVKLDELKSFLDILGIKSAEPLPKLSIKKKDFEEESKVVVLAV